MKKLAIVLALASLGGCSTIQTLMTPTQAYDPVEYNYVVQITVNATHAVHRCTNMADPQFNEFVQKINLDSLSLDEFVGDRNNAAAVLPATQQIRDLVTDFTEHDTKTMSVAYCQHKLSNIQSGARTFARAINNNAQYDFCQSGVKARYNLFAASYKAKAITKDEFSELTADLLKLEKIDTSGCTTQAKDDLLKDINDIKTAISILRAL